MNKTIALLITLTLIASSLISQEVSTKRSIHWQIPGTYSVKKDGEFLAKGKYLRFEGANYYNSETRLPYFFDLIPIKKAQNAEIGVNVLKTSELKHSKVLNEQAESVISNEIEIQSKNYSSSKFKTTTSYEKKDKSTGTTNPVSGANLTESNPSFFRLSCISRIAFFTISYTISFSFLP